MNSNFLIMTVPQLAPEVSDPAGSTRHNCYIVDLKLKTASGEYQVEFIDSHIEEGVFIVCEYSPEFISPVLIEKGFGIVLKELNNKYSWWFNVVDK